MRLTSALFLAVVVGACTGLFAGGRPPEFVNRSVLPACGEELRGQLDGPNVAARNCLLTAFKQGQPAELVSTRPTVEGDPTTTYYRVWPSASVPVEVFHDASRDPFRSAAWTYSACTALVAIDGDDTFDVSGCSEHPRVLVD